MIGLFSHYSTVSNRAYNAVSIFSVLILLSGLMGCDGSGTTNGNNNMGQQNTQTTETGTECSGNEKRFESVLASKQLNIFDNNIASAYYNKVFATLKIVQNRYESCVNGNFTLAGYVENIITYKNVTDKTISFDYVISQNANGAYREHQGYISGLAPGAENEENTGDNTFYNLNNSQITVIIGSVDYQ